MRRPTFLKRKEILIAWISAKGNSGSSPVNVSRILWRSLSFLLLKYVEIIRFFHALSSISVRTASKEGLSVLLRMRSIRRQRKIGGWMMGWGDDRGEMGDSTGGIAGNVGGGVEKRKGCWGAGRGCLGGERGAIRGGISIALGGGVDTWGEGGRGGGGGGVRPDSAIIWRISRWLMPEIRGQSLQRLLRRWRLFSERCLLRFEPSMAFEEGWLIVRHGREPCYIVSSARAALHAGSAASSGGGIYTAVKSEKKKTAVYKHWPDVLFWITASLKQIRPTIVTCIYK